MQVNNKVPAFMCVPNKSIQLLHSCRGQRGGKCDMDAALAPLEAAIKQRRQTIIQGKGKADREDSGITTGTKKFEVGHKAVSAVQVGGNG